VTSTPTPTTGSRNPRFPLFDSCRGLAALSVLLYHVGAIGGGNTDGPLRAIGSVLDVGVPIFFAISGFLLYRPFVSARFHGVKQPDTRAYARRRALRIVPAYWVALTGLGLFSGWAIFNSDFWRYYGFLQIYDQSTLHVGMSVAWTLCVEVTFYAFLPLYNRVLSRWGLRPEREIRLLLAIALISFVSRTILGEVLGFEWPLVLALPGTFFWFVPGMLLAIWSVSTADQPDHVVRRQLFAPQHGTRTWLVAGGFFALLCALEALHAPRYLGDLTMPFVAFFMLAPAVTETVPAAGLRTLPQIALGSRALVWLGMISYSVYLYHATLMSWLDEHAAAKVFPPNHWIGLALVTFIVTAVVASASYFVVERPLMRLKGFSLPQLRTAFGLTASKVG
jgi:peptidoglycan/LPS O-acetylase OafA/YrhL